MSFASEIGGAGGAIIDFVRGCVLKTVGPTDPNVAREMPEIAPSDLSQTVRELVQFAPTNYMERANLDRKAAYIKQALADAGARVSEQAVPTRNGDYKNIIARFGSDEKDAPVIVLGAHYDTHLDATGANDNGSGLAAMIELAKVANKIVADNPHVRIEFAAYTLEECSFAKDPQATGKTGNTLIHEAQDPDHGAYCGENFKSLVGSTVHANSLKEAGANVKGVIVLETMGNFSDEPGSQDYPNIPGLGRLCGDKGNYISILSNRESKPLIDLVGNAYHLATDMDARGVGAPQSLIPDFFRSDHAAYLFYGWPAIMVTDSANFRHQPGESPAYHTSADTPEKLNYDRLAVATVGIYQAIRMLAAQS